jgi:hypothetical protein
MKILLVLLILVVLCGSIVGLSCSPPDHIQNTLSKCIHTCPDGKVLEETIPMEAKNYCESKNKEICVCEELNSFFKEKFSHVDFDEVITKIKSKCSN